MRIEAPTETLQRFAKDPNWINQPVEIIANDLKSSANESRHEWDAFYYEEKDGRLFDPVRKQNIENTSGNDEIQKMVNEELENWFLSHESGIAVHISPSGGRWNYPDEQIEIYRITYDFPGMQKKLFCSFHQFHSNFSNPEEMRRTVFTEDDSEESILQILKWVEKKSQKPIETNLIDVNLRLEKSYYYTSMLVEGYEPSLVFEQMKNDGFIGEHAIGCGASNVTVALSTDTYVSNSTPFPEYETSNYLLVWHEGTCRNCGVNTWVGPCNICAPCASRM